MPLTIIYCKCSFHRRTEGSDPPSKNAKRRGPPLEVSPDERVKQFKGDLSGDGGI